MDNAQESTISKEKNANTKNHYYSIHTFEIKIPLSKEQSILYKTLLEHHCVYNKQKSSYRNKRYYQNRKKPHTQSQYFNFFNCYDNEELFKSGISDISYIETLQCVDSYCVTVHTSITFQVNPRILLGYPENKYICIVPGRDLENIMPVLIQTLLPYGFKENDLRMSIIKRLDICANINLGNQVSAEQYLKLLRKGGLYRGLNCKYMPVDPVSHRRKHPPNEVRYIHQALNAKHTIESLSIYLKYAQMLEKSTRYDAKEIDRAKGQIRFELRISSRKVSYLRKKYECSISNDLLQIAEAIGCDIFSTYLEGMYGKGKFVKYSCAMKLIENAKHHHSSVKDTMKQIVSQTRKTDMADAFHLLPANRISFYRKYFNELGISPITLCDAWNEDEFENPVTYIQTQNVNER